MRIRFLVPVLLLAVAWNSRAADLDALQKQAKDGNATAQYRLAEIFFAGAGMPQNFAAALQLASQAAKQKEPRALYRLAAMMHEGDGIQRNLAQAGALFQEALPGLEKMAGEDDPDAMSKLGTIYTTGVTAPPDLKKGLKWIRQAAEAGWPKAQYDSHTVVTHVQNDNKSSLGPESRAQASGSTVSTRSATTCCETHWTMPARLCVSMPSGWQNRPLQTHRRCAKHC